MPRKHYNFDPWRSALVEFLRGLLAKSTAQIDALRRENVRLKRKKPGIIRLKVALLMLCALSAQAKPKQVPVTVVASPGYAGNVSGAGNYKPNTPVTISASASPNWSFASWQDGNTQATRTISAGGQGSTWTASFFTNMPPVPSNTTNLTFKWFPAAEPAADYHLHIGPSPGVYTNTVSVVATNATVILTRGATVFAAVDDTSQASGLTSGLSAEIQVTLPP